MDRRDCINLGWGSGDTGQRFLSGGRSESGELDSTNIGLHAAELDLTKLFFVDTSRSDNPIVDVWSGWSNTRSSGISGGAASKRVRFSI